MSLPTLGGDNGFATGVNDRGEIVGWAENKTHDPTCGEFTNTGQVLQFEAVMWVRDLDGRGAAANSGYRASELPPFPGDLDGAATAVNHWGEAVGISGICDGAIGGGTAEHMVMWRHGAVARELPTLGGTYWNTPMDINDQGDVVRLRSAGRRANDRAGEFPGLLLVQSALPLPRRGVAWRRQLTSALSVPT